MKNRKRHLVVAIIIALTLLFWGVFADPVAAQDAWYAEYFANRDLAGGPVLTRYETGLHFEWGSGSPGSGVPADGFSARWTHDEWFESGTYRFSYRSDDGLRVWVGNTLVVDDWRDRQAGWSIVDRFISRGTHQVRVEYYEHTGSAILQVAWQRASGGAGWRGEYFANRDLAGSPVLVRYDPAIDFDWKDGSPDPAVPADKFSVRWKRTVDLTPGTYRFFTSSDDGVRIYVNEGLIVDAWGSGHLHSPRNGDVTLGNGQHTIVVEYCDRGGNASAHVWWNRVGEFSGWQGRYYDNAQLRGGPVLIRDDVDINFDWGEGGPTASMPSDSFSVSWTRQVEFRPDYYRFNVRSDDGGRVWLDKALVMDYWQPMDYQWHYADGFYLEGVHTLTVEYWERGGGARIRFWWEPSSATPSPDGPASPAANLNWLKPIGPAAPSSTLTSRPVSQPVACAGDPLQLDAWPVDQVCTGSTWKATIFVEGHGGDCQYTYAWERQVQGGPMLGPMTFEVKSASRGSAIVGEASVTSGEQTVVVGLHIRAPKTCK
jgi:hypothetical protein